MSGDGTPGSGYIRLIRRLLVTFALASIALPATDAVAQPNSAQRALERRLGPQAVVDIDAETGTPRVLARLDGTLTGAASGTPEDVAMDYVRGNLDVLGLTESDLETLETPDTSTAGGVTEVRWRQAVDGIPAADSELRVNLTRDGRVLNVLGSPAPDLDPDTTPSLTPGEALRSVQDAVGSYRSLPRDSGPSGATRATEYVDGTDAELSLFKGRLAWRVMLHASSSEVYDTFVDAETGRVLQRHNMVKSAAGDALVWDRFPGNGPGGTAATKNFFALGYLTAGTTTLSGPNVLTFSDLDTDDNLDGGEAISAAGGSFEFPFSPFAHSSCNASRLCGWAASAATRTANREQNGVQAFYLANRFYKEYLEEAPISFTEANGDQPFINGDRLIVHTHDGANTGPDNQHLNNANMLTPPDGTSPVMQMYLWAPDDFRAVNGGDDASILYHEYSHGLSNRLVTDAGDVGALNTPQAGAMGEAWGDWYAKDFLVSQFPQLDDTAAPAEVDMGDYIDLVPHSIRRQALDCPVTGATALQCPAGFGNTGTGGFTYADFGKVNGFPEVHGDGEIWAQTLWDLREVIGSTEARRVITQGMRLSPPEPSFLDMRNAILQAAGSAAQRAQIWGVFANRGMGFFAATTGSIDVTPIADNSLPPAAGVPRGRIAGTVVDTATNAPVSGVKATIGGLENGPDALLDTTDAGGAFAVENVPAHTYPSFLFKAAGYDQLVAEVPVVSGGTTTLAARLRRNWASSSGGATAAGDDTYANLGCGTQAAIDQNPGAGWSTDFAHSRQMVVDLKQPVNITSFGVDATASCGDPTDAATRVIRIETSATGGAGSFVRAVNDAFVTFNRDHLVQEFPPAAGTGANVRFVRVTLVNNHGNATFVDLSEFFVYNGPAASVDVTPPPAATPTATAVPTAIPTAVPTPVPTVTPTPKATLRLDASGRRAAKLRVTCPARCSLVAKLTVNASTAKRLGLRGSRTIGTARRTLAAGSITRITVTLTARARQALTRSRLRSFKATLTAKAGGTDARRQVTIRR